MTKPSPSRLLLLVLFVVNVAVPSFCSPVNPDFSGTWQLSNSRSLPARTGAVTLHIQHRDPHLTVETDVLRGDGKSRHAVQSYTTDGAVSVTTGADGDEFHTSVVWRDQSLVFSVEEHEDGRIILSQERWKLIDNGASLERIRENSAPGAAKQTLIYVRQNTSTKADPK